MSPAAVSFSGIERLGWPAIGKQRCAVALADWSLMALADLWENWRSPGFGCAAHPPVPLLRRPFAIYRVGARSLTPRPAILLPA